MALQPEKIPCAVLYAGTEVQLAIEHRQGRAPVRVLATNPNVQWLCADGRVEELILEGPTGNQDRIALTAELEGQGLLVAEMFDMTSSYSPPAAHWLASKEAP